MQEAKTLFERELEEKCQNVIEYKERDTVVIEINNQCMSGLYIDGYGTIKGGKQTLEISGKFIPVLISKTATKEDVDFLQLKRLQIGKMRKNYLKSIQDEQDRQPGGLVRDPETGEMKSRTTLTEDDINFKLDQWFERTNEYKMFFDERGYAIPEIRFFKFIENKGPSHDNIEVRAENEKTLMAQVLEQNKMMTELIKALTQNSKK